MTIIGIRSLSLASTAPVCRVNRLILRYCGQIVSQQPSPSLSFLFQRLYSRSAVNCTVGSAVNLTVDCTVDNTRTVGPEGTVAVSTEQRGSRTSFRALVKRSKIVKHRHSDRHVECTCIGGPCAAAGGGQEEHRCSVSCVGGLWNCASVSFVAPVLKSIGDRLPLLSTVSHVVRRMQNCGGTTVIDCRHIHSSSPCCGKSRLPEQEPVPEEPRTKPTTSPDVPRTPYETAIYHLNSLQSNAITIQKMKEDEKRQKIRETNIEKTIDFLHKCRIEVSSLDKLNVIHISGTKGKGSTCAFAEAILRRLGFKTGFYSSPHLVHARERIRINGCALSEKLFTKHFFTIYNRLMETTPQDLPPYFKFLTLMGYHVFLQENVDVAIVEVGIGGEYDCTNVVQHPITCGVSTLDIDHVSILGSTLAEIAWHKAGIFKTGSQAFASPSSDDAVAVLERRSVEREAPLNFAPDFSTYTWCRPLEKTGIAGDHQKLNVALALQLVRQWLRSTGHEAEVFTDATWTPGSPYLVPEKFVEAIEQCSSAGRSHVVDNGQIRYFLDGAHTPKSVEGCVAWFNTESSSAASVAPRKRVLIFHCTGERSAPTLLSLLKNLHFERAIFCPTRLEVEQTRKSDLTNYNADSDGQMLKSRQCAETWTELNAGASVVCECIHSSLKEVERLAEESGEPLDVFVTGSFHLVGGVLAFIQPDVQ